MQKPAGFTPVAATYAFAVNLVVQMIFGLCDEIIACHWLTIWPAALDPFTGRRHTQRRAVEARGNLSGRDCRAQMSGMSGPCASGHAAISRTTRRQPVGKAPSRTNRQRVTRPQILLILGLYNQSHRQFLSLMVTQGPVDCICSSLRIRCC